MNKVTALCAVLLLLPAATTGQEAKGTEDLEFTVLWDNVLGWPDWDPKDGEFSGMGRELLDMGAKILDLGAGRRYNDEVLEGIDIVIIILRYKHMGSPEQQALVRYVRNGGSLLVLCKYGDSISPLNPILTNFGIEITGYISKAKHLNAFAHPASTDRRKVTDVEIYEGRKIKLKSGAIPIAGYNPSAPPAGMSDIIFALGGQSGRGRVVAAGNTNQWLSNLSPCGTPLWGYVDNTKFFRNVIEYLLGFSDLKLKKLKCKTSIKAGKNVLLKARVQNLEACYNRPLEIAFYLSLDNEFQEEEDTQIGLALIPGIKGKKSKLIKHKAKIPMLDQLGAYYILARINPVDEPFEINEKNNIAAKKVILK